MKFFILCFIALTVLCAIYWACDAPGSGMAYPTGFFALLGSGTAIYSKVKTGKWLSDSAAGR